MDFRVHGAGKVARRTVNQNFRTYGSARWVSSVRDIARWGEAVNYSTTIIVYSFPQRRQNQQSVEILSWWDSIWKRIIHQHILLGCTM